MVKVLFVCSQNRLCSPTAEQVFSTWPGIDVSSAGLNNDAENPLTPELVEWADMIFVMEKAHRNKLAKQFKHSLKNARIICLNIPDELEYMAPPLVSILNVKVSKFLPARK